MKTVISSERVPIKMWLDRIEGGAMEQALHLANLPFAFKHIAIMPDAHQGYGMPIGGILATNKVIIPNAVGKDIGCGMCAVMTSIETIKDKVLRDIREEIINTIPIGFGKWNKEPMDSEYLPYLPENPKEAPTPVLNSQYEKILYQLRTLGGGNHFIEIQIGSDGYIWAMLHSGSRNLGSKVCDHYNKKAKMFSICI